MAPTRLAPGDYGVLTLVNGAYQLQEKDGTLTVFNTDGTLDYVQDTDGNRITAGYTTKLLTSLTDSNGEQLSLAYNLQGLISQVTDAQGQVTNYTYDSTGQLLLSVSNNQGTTQYTYVTGQSAAEQYALASITNPDGTQQFLTYNSEGRKLTNQSAADNAEEVS